MTPFKNNQSFFENATFVLRKTSAPNQFQIESFSKAKQFLVPGSPKVVRFKRDDGSENFKFLTNITIENPEGVK